MMEIKYLYYLLFAGDDLMDKLELFDGSLPVEEITNSWYNEYKNSNYGAIITFFSFAFFCQASNHDFKIGS